MTKNLVFLNHYDKPLFSLVSNKAVIQCILNSMNNPSMYETLISMFGLVDCLCLLIVKTNRGNFSPSPLKHDLNVQIIKNPERKSGRRSFTLNVY